jgi:hypothetical protein
MDHIEAGAADVDGTFAFNVVASLERGRGVVLSAEGAACVAGWREAYVEGREVGGRGVFGEVVVVGQLLSFGVGLGEVIHHCWDRLWVEIGDSYGCAGQGGNRGQ